MKWAKKMKYKEIGQILGISEDAAMKRGQRALKRLQTIYFKESSYEKQF
jgi:RNA polymerase sigma-70 factor (ECF subfamily)